MTAEAGIQTLLRSELREGDNRRLPAMRLDVRFPGPVASFTASIGRIFLATGNTLKMRVLVKLEPNIWVTGLADDAANISTFGRLSATCRSDETEDHERLSGTLEHSTVGYGVSGRQSLPGCQAFVKPAACARSSKLDEANARPLS